MVWIESALQDLRYALRTLCRNPGFAAVAVLSLALGIGANTALFSLLDRLLLRTLPVHDPSDLVQLRIHTPKLPFQFPSFSYPLFDLIRTHASALGRSAAMESFTQSIEENGHELPAQVEVVSGEYFDVLGVGALRGRVFHDASEPLAVISEAFWRTHYGGSAAALGAHFRTAGRDYTIAGIASRRFDGAMIDRPADVWIPIEQAIAPGNPRRGPNWGWLVVVTRLAPGISHARAGAEVDALQRQFLEEQSKAARFAHPQQRAEFFDQRIELQSAASGVSSLREGWGRALLVLQFLTGLVLLIACGNLANLMLARAAAREHEISIRHAIGAARGRLIRQLLTENLLIAFAGAAAALPLAACLSAALLRFLPPFYDTALAHLSFHPDARVLGFSGALASFTCLLFGLAPAFRATRLKLMARDGGRSGRVLIAVEVAFCTILLLGAGWFVRTLENLHGLDAGFDPNHLLVATVLPPAEYSGARDLQLFEEARDRLAALPQVRASSYSNLGLMTGDQIVDQIDAEGHTSKNGEDLTATELRISPGFFAAMGTPLLRGRDFNSRDDASAAKAAIVNEAFARQFFDGRNPIGLRFTLAGTKSIEVVGMVKNTKYANLREQERPIFYRPFRQVALDKGMVIAIRSSGDPRSLAPALRAITREIDPRLSLRQVVPFSEMVDRTLATERMVAQISAAFGVLALIVACIGIYGMLAYRVARRTREIGVRIALGASRASVQWMILRECLTLLVIGAVIGIPIALAAARLVTSMLYGLTPADPLTMAAALGILLLVALAAAYLPARRASRVDPAIALRCE